VAAIAETAKAFGLTALLSDQYARDWPKEEFAQHGIDLINEPKDESPDKVITYSELRPYFLQNQIQILDNQALQRELAFLEYVNKAGGKPRIDHPSGGHDDHAAALALAVYGMVRLKKALDSQPQGEEMTWQEHASLMRAMNTNIPIHGDASLIGDPWAR